MSLRVATTLVVSALLSSEVMRISAEGVPADVKPCGGVSYMSEADLSGAHSMSGFYDIAVRKIDGTEDLLGALRGKVTLAVNVASRCGLTPQYTGLEQLQRELRQENFTVVGFPCNQFAAQEPGSETEIAAFCSTNYQGRSPLSASLGVNAANRHPLYRFLTSEDRGIAGDISWNFEKFLIGRDGRVLKCYPPDTTPHDRRAM